MTAQAIRPTTLQEQARALRADFPELYDYLNTRDEKLRRALNRVPSPADIELSATWNHRKYIERTMNALGPGLTDLIDD